MKEDKYTNKIKVALEGITPDYPISANTLAVVLRIPETHATCPNTRACVRAAIQSGVPIGSNSKGYFMITSEQQMQVYLNRLLQRQVKLAARITDVYRAYYGRV